MNDANKVASTFDFVSLFWPPISNQMASGGLASGGGASFAEICGSRNGLVWTCVFFWLFYSGFGSILKALLRRHIILAHTHNATTRFAWNCCFYAASVVCLAVYFYMFLAASIRRDSGPLFPKYESPLIMPTNNCALFAAITNLLMAFYITAGLIGVNEQDYAEAVTKLLYVPVLGSLNANGLENFSVILNVWLGVFNLATDAMQLVALHTDNSCRVKLRFMLILRLLSWSFVCLHMLPFDFLIPTLYAKQFKVWLNVSLLLWYGSNVWNSPLLYFCYHQFYHQYEACSATNSIARCVLVRPSVEYQHFLNLQIAYNQIRLANDNTKLTSKPSNENTAARTYQTIKSMMTIKRKLKRIRASRDNANSIQGMPMLPC